MGVVWAAKNEAIDRDVAIKTIHANAAHHRDAIPRFLNEARICGSIRHPGIVDVLDLGQDENGSPFLVMERLNGETLDALMSREGVSPEHLFRVVRDVARTIALAHARGVVHRDLKPANIFLHRAPTGETVTKVLDFGISKVLDASIKATSTGAIMGSPAYMSPEQAGGRGAIDARADIFALGVILFEGLSGRLPFMAPNSNALMVDLATKDAPSLRQILPGVSQEVAALVDACTKRSTAERLGSAIALADALDRILAGPSPAVAAPPPAPSAASRRSNDGAIGRTAMMHAGTISGTTLAGEAPPAKAPTRLVVLAAVGSLVVAFGGYAWLAGRSQPATNAAAGTGTAVAAVPLPATALEEPKAPTPKAPTPSVDLASPSSATAASASATPSGEPAPVASVKHPGTKPRPKAAASGKRTDSVYGEFR